MNTVTIREADWQQDQDALKLLRTEVFIKEQEVPEELEWDEEDADAAHFLAFVDEEPAGSVRLTRQGQLSRLCVLSRYRNYGIGSKLLQAAEEKARALGYPEIHLHAQTHATSFYELAGYAPAGGIFMEANIPHRFMSKSL